MLIVQVEIKEVVEGKCNINFSHDAVGQATPTETKIAQNVMRMLTNLLQPQAPKGIVIPGSRG